MFLITRKLFFTLRSFITIFITIFFVLSLVLLVPNISLILGIVKSESSSLVDVVRVIWGIYSSAPTLLPPLSWLIIITTGTLFGFNAVLGREFKLRMGNIRTDYKSTSGGLFALIASLFGIGCASCGSLLATSALSVLGLGSFLAYLPFGGLEFALVGIAFLLWANYKLTKSLSLPMVCK